MNRPVSPRPSAASSAASAVPLRSPNCWRRSALALCTIVAATVVTAGIARADVVGNVVGHEGSLFAVALVLGLLFIGMGGLTVLSLTERPRHHRH